MSLARFDVPELSAYFEHCQLASVLAYLWALRQAACLWLVLRHINHAAIQYQL